MEKRLQEVEFLLQQRDHERQDAEASYKLLKEEMNNMTFMMQQTEEKC